MRGADSRPWLWTFTANARYPAPWNHTGFPAVSVRAGVLPRTGTPPAVYLVARGGEPLLLGVAAQLERLAPWPRLAPGY